MPIRNAITVDVEDYFQVSAFEKSVDREMWDSFPLRVVENTQKLLTLFDKYHIKGTFFVLGWVAERVPSLIKDIDGRGHEVACHGYSHQLVYNQTPQLFKEETIKSKDLLEDIIQKPVNGYRAASYSITNKSLWALDILAEAGFTYDSSIFPVRHDRYGVPGAPDDPYIHEGLDSGRQLIEFPLSAAKVFNYKLPVAGGGYFRLYPYVLTKLGLKQINRQNRPFIFYLHPWEIDPDQPRIEASRFSKFRHYNNLDKCQSRLESLLHDFTFGRVDDVLHDLGLL